MLVDAVLNLEDFTISTWFKSDWSSDNGGDWVYIMGSQDKYSFTLSGIHNSGGSALRFNIEQSNGVWANIQSKIDLSDNNWHHAAVTRYNQTGLFKMIY